MQSGPGDLPLEMGLAMSQVRPDPGSGPVTGDWCFGQLGVFLGASGLESPHTAFARVSFARPCQCWQNKQVACRMPEFTCRCLGRTGRKRTEDGGTAVLSA